MKERQYRKNWFIRTSKCQKIHFSLDPKLVNFTSNLFFCPPYLPQVGHMGCLVPKVGAPKVDVPMGGVWVMCGWCVGGVCVMCGEFKGKMT